METLLPKNSIGPMLHETELYERLVDDRFMENLDRKQAIEYERESEKSPADLIHKYEAAGVQRGGYGNRSAIEARQEYLRIVVPDADYYGVTPEMLFDMHWWALNEEYSNADFGEYTIYSS